MADPFEFEVPATCAHLGPGFGILGVAIDLAMHIHAEPLKQPGYGVVREGVMSHEPKDPRHDAILRSMLAMSERFEIKLPPGMKITAQNRIPAFTGLGTNAAAFAAGFGIAARFAKRIPPADELVDLLVELGGTAAHGGAALYGGLVACSPVHIGNEQVSHRVLRYPLADSWQFVLACPNVRVGTADVVRVLPANLPHGATKRTTGRLLGLLHALAVGDEALLRQCVVDEVHVPFRRELVPGMDRAIRDAGATGAAVTISGAGPALVAITKTDAIADASADAMQAAFRDARVEAEILRVRPTVHGGLPAD